MIAWGGIALNLLVINKFSCCFLVSKSWARKCIRFVNTFANPHCPDIQNCKRSQVCHSDTESCFSTFKYDAKEGLFRPIASGCKWFPMRTKHCNDQTGNLTDSCVLHEDEDNLLHCCCNGDNCNKNLVFSKMNYNATITLVNNIFKVKGGVTLPGIFFIF